MKSKWLSFFAMAGLCLIGMTDLAAAQQGYVEQINSCPQCSSSPQFEPSQFESYQPSVTYQSPVYESGQFQPVTHYPSAAVSGTFDTVQTVYADQVYYGSTSYPVVETPVVSYPVVETPVVSYPVVSAPVYSSSEVYQAQSYPSQGSQTIQQFQQSSYSPAVRTVSYSGNSGNFYTSTNPQPGLAQQKATQAAQMSFRNHVGGSLGGAKFEGVGWSNQSPQTAIQNCCYWGQRPPAQIGVSKSQDGCWYACVLYH